MHRTPSRARALCAHALATPLALVAAPASAQVWIPESINSSTSAQTAIQAGLGGPIESDVHNDNSYGLFPIPPADLFVESDLHAFGARAFAQARLVSVVDATLMSLELSCSGGVEGAVGVLPQSLGYSIYSFIFTINEPTFVTINAHALVDIPQSQDFGFGSGNSTLRHFQGQFIDGLSFGGSSPPDGLSFEMYQFLEPGRYELFGGISAGVGARPQGESGSALASMSLTFEAPAPASGALLALAGLTAGRRRR